MISIIAAIASNHAIGKDNQLLWHLSDDLKRFRELTWGKTVIMGRNTWLSLPRRPLPGRRNIVLTDRPGECEEGCIMVNNIESALQLTSPDEEVFIIGGGSVYRQFMPLAHQLYITRINQPFDADTFFPEISPDQWELTEHSDWYPAPEGSFMYRFEKYRRKD